MIQTPKRLDVIGALLVLTLSACSGVGGIKDSLSEAPVPEKPGRFTVEVMADTSAAVQQAVNGAVCLIRNGVTKALSCQDDTFFILPCNNRTREDVEALFQPVFDKLIRLQLTSASTDLQGISDLIPGAFATENVSDARRASWCGDWETENGACLAVRFESLWILLHAPWHENDPDDEEDDAIGPIDRIELFLAENTCERNL